MSIKFSLEIGLVRYASAPACLRSRNRKQHDV